MTQPQPYNPPPAVPPDAAVGYQGAAFVDRDQEHMKILSICWYVLSALAALMGCVPIIHVTIGLLMLLSPSTFAGGSGGPPPAAVGWLFLIMGSCFMLVGWTGAVLAFLTARSMGRRRRLMLCYVTAALACLQMPFGTCLGIFTFIVLGRPSVKSSFT